MKKIILLIGIVTMGLFLRLYAVSSIPNGLQQDETSIGYNAYSLLKTGKDEHNVHFPSLFSAFGEQKLPGYIYLTVPSLYFFGLTPLGVRFPSVALGTFSILLTAAIVYEIFYKSKQRYLYVLISAFTLATNPWHTFFSRGGFEVTAGLFFLLFSTYLFLFSLRKQYFFLLFLSSFFSIVAFYTYNTLRIMAPVLLLSLFIFYRDSEVFKKNARMKYISLVGLLILLLSPFILTFSQASHATKGTLIFSSAVVQSGILEFRSYMSPFPDILEKLLFSVPLLTAITFIHNLMRYISVPFFFLTGSSHGNHSIGSHGYFYLFQLPVLLLGMWTIRKKTSVQFLVGIWIILCLGIAALTRESPQATRSFFLIFPFVLIITEGSVYLLNFLKSQKKIYQKLAFALTSIIVVYSIISYLASYTLRFPTAYAKEWRSADRDISLWIAANEYKYDQILIDQEAGLIYTSLLFYSKFSPELFQQTAERTPPDSEGFITVTAFGKYRYEPINWDTDLKKPRTLIVTTEKRKPPQLKILIEVKYPKKPIVLALKQEILQYPVEESAYVAISSD